MARNVEFDILARDRASKTFDHVAKSSDGLGSRLGMFGKAAGLALGGAATAVAGLGAAGVLMGIKTAAANEQAQISFTTMLGSAKKAQVFLKQLQAFAAATPFEFPELQTAASSLISAGINANKVIPIMRTLGDVTAGMGTGSEGIKRATVALQQMNAAGKISGEDLNQLRDAGIPVYDLLSKALGKTKAEVVKLAQSGKLGQDALDKMMKALENGKGLERFSGLMDKQSHSLTGLWSTFKDTLGQGLAKAIEPVIPLLKDGLGKASEFLAKVLPKVAAGLATMMKWLAGSHPQLAKFADGAKRIGTFIMTNVVPAIQRFGGWLKNDLWPALQKGYRTIMPGLKQALDILKSAFGSSGKGGQSFGDTMRNVGKFITNYVIPVIAAVESKWLPAMARGFAVLVGAVRVAWQAFQIFRDVQRAVVTAVLRGFAAMASGFASLLRALGHVPGFGWARAAADKLQNAANKAYAFANAINYIPANKTVTVNTYYKTHGTPKGGGDLAKGYAVGGTNLPRGWKIVGEQGPELMWTPGGDTVIPSGQTRALLNGRNSGGAAVGGGNITIGSIVLGPGSTRQQAEEFWKELLKIKRQRGTELGLA